MSSYRNKKSAITVLQHFNPMFDSSKAIGPENEEHVYLVKSAKNTTYPKLDEWLTREAVDRMIEEGMTVNISPMEPLSS